MDYIKNYEILTIDVYDNQEPYTSYCAQKLYFNSKI